MSTTLDRDWATLADALDVTTENAARERVQTIATELRETLRWQATGGRVEHSTHELAQEIGAPESVVRNLLTEMHHRLPDRLRRVDGGRWRYEPVDEDVEAE